MIKPYMKFIKLFENYNEIDMDEIMSEFDSLKRSLRDKYKAMSSNARSIKAAKDTAKKYKIKVQEILKQVKPDNNLSNDKTWDSNGIIR